MQRQNAIANRAIAIGLVLLALTLVYLAAVKPYLDTYRGYRDNIATLSDRLQRYRAIAGTRSDTLQRIQQLRGSRELTRSFLNSKTPTLASAELQQYVTRVVNQTGGKLLSTQVLPPKDKNGMVATTIKIGMRGTSETLQKLFHTLERGRPLVLFDQVSVRNHRRRAKAEVLDIRFGLTGYVRPATP